jgi:poly-beta-1,6-N-acetyl-D-glucosamine synthase
MKNLTVSIGLFAHNEESNIKKALDSIQKQKTDLAVINEIFIVSSGSFDKTNQIIRSETKKDLRIKFLEQFQRQGKASAINYFLTKAKSQILIIVSADLRLHIKAIEEITLPFLHSNVGIVGAHPIPINLHQSQIGKEIKLLWQLHHLISLKNPKCGEMIAFRNVIRSIPKNSAVDEANLEVLLKLIGFKVIYAPHAIVYNKPPKNLKEFLYQRRRIYCGHLHIQNQYQYQVSTNNKKNLSNAILNYLNDNPSDIPIMANLIFWELLGRALGWFDYHVLGRNPYIWQMVSR